MSTQFKVKKNLTPPLLKFVSGEPRYVKILNAMFIGKAMKEKEGAKKKEPATLCDVVNLETGEASQIIVNAVVKSVFTESYPNDGYVGKGFEITKRERVGNVGSEYFKFSVQEIELPEESAPKPVTDTKAKK